MRGLSVCNVRNAIGHAARAVAPGELRQRPQLIAGVTHVNRNRQRCPIREVAFARKRQPDLAEPDSTSITATRDPTPMKAVVKQRQ